MSEPSLNHVQCLTAGALHRMAYWEWGERDNLRVLVCVHGLSRQGRDFDRLAQALSPRWRVVCPDVVGRGRSDALADPLGYQIPTYVADMVTLLARLDAPQVQWLGTSMGGLIGMMLASMRHTPISRLVLNDVGPSIQFAALQRIATYLGRAPTFSSLHEGAEYLRGISKGFGPHTPQQWLELSRPMLRAHANAWALHYDAKIAQGLAGLTPKMVVDGEAYAWAAFDAIQAPTLVLRGVDSDVLTRQTAQAMTQRGPRAQLHEFVGVGHAPTLVTDEQIEVVRSFLEPP